MKTALFILAPLIIFGIAIYVYLRKEQDKFIPKDKYDEAMDDIYKKRRSWGKNSAKLMGASFETGLSESFLALNPSYLLILIATFFIAGLINIFPVSVAAMGPFFGFILIICLIFFPVSLVLFPAGLMHIAQIFSYSLYRPQIDLSGFLSVVFGWLIYFIVIMFGARAKSRSAFIVIYFIFAALLILNIVGCTQDASTFCENGCSS